jgi:hypothetical protein
LFNLSGYPHSSLYFESKRTLTNIPGVPLLRFLKLHQASVLLGTLSSNPILDFKSVVTSQNSSNLLMSAGFRSKEGGRGI